MNYYEIIYETTDFEENAIFEAVTIISEDIANALTKFLKNNEITIDEVISISFDSIVHD
tara:strand:- start:558 stop:734 length:177 start_codon:yes stop_codon:yes gene_type:complete